MNLFTQQHATRMKNLIGSILFIPVFLLTTTSCKEDDVVADGPDFLLRSSGILCTMGRNRDNKIDTLAYYFDTGGRQLTEYRKGSSRPVDRVEIVLNGSGGSPSIQHTTPHVGVSNGLTYRYFTIYEYGGAQSPFPDNEFEFTWKANSSPDTEFVVVRNADDPTKFTIESKSRPGNYLGAAMWTNATYPTEDHFVFSSKKQEWFFMED